VSKCGSESTMSLY